MISKKISFILLIHEFSFYGDVEAVRRLLKIPLVRETINEKDRFGETAYFMAKERGHREIIDILVENGADSTP